jgi:hypothetical protein
MANIITRMMTAPKRAKTIVEEGLQKFTRAYTDGSVMEERVGCSVICRPEEIKIRLAEQTCIFNADAQTSIKATIIWGIVKRIVITDSLSNIMAQETLYTKGNSKKTELKDFWQKRAQTSD